MRVNLKMLMKALEEHKLPKAAGYGSCVLEVEDFNNYIDMSERRFSEGNADAPVRNSTIQQVRLKSVQYRRGERTWYEWEIEL